MKLTRARLFLFSLLFLPFKSTIGRVGSAASFQSAEMISDGGDLVTSTGTVISLTSSDLILVPFLLWALSSKKIDIRRFRQVTLLSLAITAGSLSSILFLDSSFAVLIYSLRFCLYLYLFTVKDAVYLDLFSQSFRSPYTYLIAFFICILSLLSLTIDFPVAFIASRPEFYIPVSFFCLLSVFFSSGKTRLSYSTLLQIGMILLSALTCGKRAVSLSVLIPFILFVALHFNVLKKPSYRVMKTALFVIPVCILILFSGTSILTSKTLVASKDYEGYGTSVEYSRLLEDSEFSAFAGMVDSSSAERLAKILRSNALIVEKPLTFVFPSGLNSFKHLYGFLPDSSLQAINELGVIIFTSVILLFFSSIRKFFTHKYRLTRSERALILFPAVSILCISATLNIFTMATILPFLALHNAISSSILANRLSS